MLSQNVIPSRRSLGGSRPLAFTEQGISMLSSVLTSDRAIEVNIAIMRTFVRLRQLLATHEDLARQLEELRWKQEEQGQQIQAVFETIQHLIEAPAEPKPRIGFRPAGPATSHKPATKKGRNSDGPQDRRSLIAGTRSSDASRMMVQFLGNVLTAYLDFAFAPPGLCEVVSDLHPQPRFRRAAERF